MNDQNPRCPNCGTELTELKGGLKCCPACGFEGDKPKTDSNAPSGRSQVIFWIALISPATMALVIFLMGRGSSDLRNTAFGIGLVAFFLGVVASIYCGVWLARRFCQKTETRLALGIVSTLAIGAVNLTLIFAGCAASLNFH